MELTVAGAISPAYKEFLRSGGDRGALRKKLGATKEYANSVANELNAKGFVGVSDKNIALLLPADIIGEARIFDAELVCNRCGIRIALGLDRYYIYLEHGKHHLVGLIRERYFDGMARGMFKFGERITIGRILKANGLEWADAFEDGPADAGG